MSLSSFYSSTAWGKFRDNLKLERTVRDGGLYCDFCGAQILKPYDAICHHVIPLTESNVGDLSISLNPDNIQILHHHCHALTHARMSVRKRREIYLVWGSPKSGKSTWVESTATAGDLVCDLERIYRSIGADGIDNRYSQVAFLLWEELLDAVKVRKGKWESAYIVGTYPIEAERKRLMDSLGAEEVFIDTPRGVCLERCKTEEEIKYVEKWWILSGRGSDG